MNRPRAIFLLAIFLMAGCAMLEPSGPNIGGNQAPPMGSATVEPAHLPQPLSPTVDVAPASARATIVGMSPAPILAPVAQPTLSSSARPLSAEWEMVEWNELMIPIPPNASWNPDLNTDASIGTIPVLAAGAVTYPTITGTVELPFGPMFTIFQFSGSLDDWIAHERTTNALAVDQQTLHDTLIADRPAKVYQPVVIGTCNAAAYIVALDRERLLRIWTDCLDHEPYDRVIKRLQIK